MSPRFLVTGAHGCIGAWVVHELLEDGHRVATFDLSTDPRRLRLLLDEPALAVVPHVAGDIADPAALESALDEHEITNVIHLAALQVPFCRADPPLGARVNVLGTVNVFEAVRRRAERTAPVVYASSVGAFDAPEEHVAPSMTGHPGTLYGVFKRANESTAFVYREENGVSSIGLRPHTVYGVGRDQGLTSAPTSAMLAAAAGAHYRIPFGGSAQLQHARDVARAFIAASLSGYEGASVAQPARPDGLDRRGRRRDRRGRARERRLDRVRRRRASVPRRGRQRRRSARSRPTSRSRRSSDGVRETIERFRALLSAGLVEAPAPDPKAVG